MSVRINIEIQDGASPALRQFVEGLEDKTRLHGFVGRQVQSTTGDYLRRIAATRHKTARSLGARPTGHLERAAQSVSTDASHEEARVGITSPGIARAFRPIEITPGAGKKYLTIPATGVAYGKKAGEFGKLKFIPFGGRANPKARALAKVSGKGKSKTTIVLYWLVKRVTLRQDRTLLPSDELWEAAGIEGAKTYVRRIIQESGGGGATVS